MILNKIRIAACATVNLMVRQDLSGTCGGTTMPKPISLMVSQMIGGIPDEHPLVCSRLVMSTTGQRLRTCIRDLVLSACYAFLRM